MDEFHAAQVLDIICRRETSKADHPGCAFATLAVARALIRLWVQPHETLDLGSADVSIGPHTFYNTAFYEIRWSTEAPPSASTPPSEGLPPLSQSLSNRLHTEAAKDKLLMGILQRVTAKQATPQESSALNRYIIALRASMLSMPRSPSLILEFADNSGERFLLPSVLQAVPSAEGLDLNFHLIPNSASKDPPATLVTMQMSNLAPNLFESFARLAAAALPANPDQPRVYLQLRSVDKAAPAVKQPKTAPSNTLKVSSTAKATKATAKGDKKSKTKAVRKKLPGDKTSADGKKGPGRPRKEGAAKGKGKERIKSKAFVDEDEGKEVAGEAELEVEGEGEELMASIKAKPTKRQSSKLPSPVKEPSVDQAEKAQHAVQQAQAIETT